jgi:hypothetical protein
MITIRNKIGNIANKFGETFPTNSIKPTLFSYQSQRKASQEEKNFQLIPLMNIDAKVLNKLLTN